jgi:hypothetical protein
MAGTILLRPTKCTMHNGGNLIEGLEEVQGAEVQGAGVQGAGVQDAGCFRPGAFAAGGVFTIIARRL